VVRACDHEFAGLRDGSAKFTIVVKYCIQ
jgi:hypothetical protein